MSPYELSRFRQLLPSSLDGTLKQNVSEFQEYQALIHEFSQTYYGRIQGMEKEPQEIEAFLTKNPGYFSYLVSLEATLQTELNQTTVVSLSRNIVSHYKAAEDQLFPASLGVNDPLAIRQRIARDDAFIELLMENAKNHFRTQTLSRVSPNVINAPTNQQHGQIQDSILTIAGADVSPYIAAKYAPPPAIPFPLLATQPNAQDPESLIDPTVDLKSKYYELQTQFDASSLAASSKDLVQYAHSQGLNVNDESYVATKIALFLEAGFINPSDIDTPAGSFHLVNLISYLGSQEHPTTTPHPLIEGTFNPANAYDYIQNPQGQNADAYRDKFNHLLPSSLPPTNQQDLLSVASRLTQDEKALTLLRKIPGQIQDHSGLTSLPTNLFTGTPVSLITPKTYSDLATATNNDRKSFPSSGLPVPLSGGASTSRKQTASATLLKEIYDATPSATLGQHPDVYDAATKRVIHTKLQEFARNHSQGELAAFYKDNPFLSEALDAQDEIYFPAGDPSSEYQQQSFISGGGSGTFVKPSSPFATPLSFLANPGAAIKGYLGRKDGQRAFYNFKLAEELAKTAAGFATYQLAIKPALGWAIDKGPLAGLSSRNKFLADALIGRRGATDKLLNEIGNNIFRPQMANTAAGLSNLSTTITGLASSQAFITPIAVGSIIGFILFFFVPIIQVAPLLSTLAHLESGIGSAGFQAGSGAGFCWPVDGTITQLDKIDSPSHIMLIPGGSGLDIGAPNGSPIYAPLPGSYIFHPWDGGMTGNYITATSKDGSVNAAFLHAAGSNLAPNQPVEMDTGAVIGSVDSTGNSTGAHLHYEIDSGGHIYSLVPPPNPPTLGQAVTHLQCSRSTSGPIVSSCTEPGPYGANVAPPPLSSYTNSIPAYSNTIQGQPQVIAAVNAFVRDPAVSSQLKAGQRIAVTAGFRGYQEQLDLCTNCAAQKVTDPNARCMAAPAAQSNHRGGLAVDMYIYDPTLPKNFPFRDFTPTLKSIAASHRLINLPGDPPHYDYK